MDTGSGKTQMSVDKALQNSSLSHRINWHFASGTNVDIEVPFSEYKKN
jgi:hypothetical protein